MLSRAKNTRDFLSYVTWVPYVTPIPGGMGVFPQALLTSRPTMIGQISSRRLPTDSVDNLENDQTDCIAVWPREFWSTLITFSTMASPYRHLSPTSIAQEIVNSRLPTGAFTPPTRLNSTAESRRRCVLGIAVEVGRQTCCRCCCRLATKCWRCRRWTAEWLCGLPGRWPSIYSRCAAGSC